MTARKKRSPAPVYLEEGTRRIFAVAVDWPGWARSGKTEETALEALATYLDRYEVAVRRAGLEPPDEDAGIEIVARVRGNATTDFGAPGVVADLDRRTWTPREADRQARLVSAAWVCLDAAAAAGAPAGLRKGPRGGGRDRDAIVEHVLDAEHAYLRKAGMRRPAPKDRAEADDLRQQFLDLLRSPSAHREDGDGSRWPIPYAARRVAWHALDHAWEIEDRSG